MDFHIIYNVSAKMAGNLPGEAKVEYKNITSQYHMFAIQGPKSLEMVNTLLKYAVDEQKFFYHSPNMLDDIPVYLNRGGFTGEKLGYELYIFPQKDYMKWRISFVLLQNN